jgi:UDP-GlcNAc:undecaprenyl-phosphate GlcNAc-1-phosphate transferase
MALVSAFSSFVVTIVLMLALRPVALSVGLIDVPDNRKRHDAPVPVIGGIAMAIGLAAGATVAQQSQSWPPFLLSAYILAVVGAIDDRFDLPANSRLIAQTSAAMLIVFGAHGLITHLGSPLFFELPLGLFAVSFTLRFIVTVINAFNMIDGIDGLAGGLALVSLVGMAIVAVGSPLIAMVGVTLGAVAGFLLFNLPLGFNAGVRSFMGDAGSTLLGSTIASLAIFLSQGDAPLIAPAAGLWLIAVPVFDFFSAILRRVEEGKSPFDADHNHLHHVLIDSGLSRRATLCLMVALAGVLACIGVAGTLLDVADGPMLMGWLAAGAGYYAFMRRPRAVVAAIAWALRRARHATTQPA